MNARGLSLLETVVGLALLALILPLALDLIPSSRMAQRRAGEVEAAVCLAQGWVAEATHGPMRVGRNRDEEVQVGAYTFRGSLEIYSVDQLLYDVVVSMQPARGEAIRVAQRVLYNP